MSEQAVDYAAVLADLERKRDALDRAIEGMRQVMGIGASTGSSNGAPAVQAGPDVATGIRSDSFLGMSIVEAAKKYLGMGGRQPRSTNAIVDALRMGGLPNSTYQTVYSVLRRQERTNGDIYLMAHTKEWVLPEWYPGGLPKKKRRDDKDDDEGATRNGGATDVV